jgi:hypothetical protein
VGGSQLIGATGEVMEKTHVQKLASNLGVLAAFILLWLAYAEIASFARLRLASQETDIIPRSRLQAVYKNQEWVNTLADEWKPSNQFDYQAYVGWERRPFEGQTIRVDRDGFRRTFHSQCDPDTYTIWMFGGSTVWGAGVPDWLTIPSLLGQQFEQAGRNVCIRNYGEKAWVNTQELIKLILELKRDERKPDLVIFYDGPADVYATYQSGLPGLHQNFDEMKHLYEGHAAEGPGNFQYLLKTNAARLFFQHRLSHQIGTRGLAKDADALAQQAVRCYVENLKVVDLLARAYGFKYAVFWEPTIYSGKKPLTPDEETAHQQANKRSPGLEKTDQVARVLVDSMSPPHFFDIADVFDQLADTIYFDEAHVSAEGNRLVAERIYSTLQVHP